jgi:hypothetical protein
MQWIHLTRRGSRFRTGRAAWMSASLPLTAKWRWHARRSGGSVARLCPLREYCPEREMGWAGTRVIEPEAGPAGAGSVAVDWDDDGRGWS